MENNATAESVGSSPTSSIVICWYGATGRRNTFRPCILGVQIPLPALSENRREIMGI